MHKLTFIFAFLISLSVGAFGPAFSPAIGLVHAQNAPQVAAPVATPPVAVGWLGAVVETVTPDLMQAYGLIIPGGVVVKEVAKFSPAEKAGIKPGDQITYVGRSRIDNKAMFGAAISGRFKGAKIALVRMRTGEVPKKIIVILGVKPKPNVVVSNKRPLVASSQLMLDTGGHMSLIRYVVFTPDGNQIVSASEDKLIRIWDWRSGKTVRTIRGESAAGDAGKIYAMALSPDGRLLAAGACWRGLVKIKPLSACMILNQARFLPC